MRARSSLRASLLGLLVAGCSSDPVAGNPSTDAAVTTDVAVTADVAVTTDAAVTTDVTPTTDAGAFTLTSPVMANGGLLPVEYTCDGVGHSPSLAWSGAPAGTVGFVVLMTTLARDGLKWNWVLYNLPATTTALAVATAGVGTSGITSDGPALAYSPPCSRGPGPMTYTFTVYALSGRPTLPAQASQVTGAVVTEAIRTLTLASTTLAVTYTR